MNDYKSRARHSYGIDFIVLPFIEGLPVSRYSCIIQPSQQVKFDILVPLFAYSHLNCVMPSNAILFCVSCTFSK